jgi:hypothetical protein
MAHYRECKGCKQGFSSDSTRGRPPSYCPECRSARRYGWTHQKTRRDTIAMAYGMRCARCGEIMYEGQPLDLDHMDDGTYSYSHAHCNRSAGARKRNNAGNEAPTRYVPHSCYDKGCHTETACLCGLHSRAW